MSEIKLAKCPFCDSELKRWDYMPNVFFEHPYNGCILSGKKVLESEHDVKAWNTRKPMERIIERLEEELKLSDIEKERCIRENPLQFDEAKGYSTGISNAIDFVKEEGGIE